MGKLTAVDLFAGLGGWTEGARLAGVHVAWAANHWPLAVQYHSANHPDVEHACQDLRQCDFTKIPRHDILLASPSCKGHTRARGAERPHHDAERATAWAVIECAEVHRPPLVIVENVVEFTGWVLFPVWRMALEALGYHVAINVLDSADCGVPQERVRVFVTAARERAVHVASPRRAHRPARDFLRLDDSLPWSPVEGHAPATLARVARGRAAHGDLFLAPYYGSGSGLGGRSVDRPIGTITTLDAWSVVWGDRMRMLSAPEYLAAQGFRADYALPRQKAQAVDLIGNAVSPPVAQYVLEQATAQVRGNA